MHPMVLSPRSHAVSTPSSHQTTQIVIVGGGVGGFTLAKALAKKGVARLAQITVINPSDQFLFKPLLYEKLNARQIEFDMQQHILEKSLPIRFLEGMAEHIHVAGSVIETHQGPIPFDIIILATGAVTNTFGVPDASEHCIPLTTLGDMERLEASVERKLLAAERDFVNGQWLSANFSFQIIGAGTSGIELAFELHRYLQKVVKLQYPSLKHRVPMIQIIEASESILPGFYRREQRLVQKQLDKFGIKVLTNHQVKAVSPEALVLQKKEPMTGELSECVMPSFEAFWVAGVKANLPESLLPNTERYPGNLRVKVNDYLEVPTHPNIYVVGDAAGIMRPNGKGLLPMTAQVGEQQASFVAQDILNKLTGGRGPRKPFRLLDKGHFLSLGPHLAMMTMELPEPLPDLTFFGPWVAWFRHFYYGQRLR